MMKRMFLAAMAIAMTLPAAMTTLANDDDIYFKKPTKKTIYDETAKDQWSTNANDDWDLDSYNRRGVEEEVVSPELAEGAYYYEIPDGNGGMTRVPGISDSLKVATTTDYTKDIAPIHDTIFVIEQYAYCDRIRRFHNPYFGFYRYSPWYDIAYYDPFYWDYCYYDPWWYVSPSFGFHYGSWYWGWDYGYYTGWYGGWYCPYYHPYPHYYYPSYGWSGSSYAGGGIHRGNGRRDGYHGSRNNSGNHIVSRGGWRGDGGGSTRAASSGNNRSYRRSGTRTATTSGTNLRGHNASSGRMANSNMRANGQQLDQLDRTKYTNASSTSRRPASGSSASRGSSLDNTTSRTSTSASTHRATDNSTARRADVGVHQNTQGGSIRSSQTSSGRNEVSRGSYGGSTSSRNSGSYSSNSSYGSSPSRSSSASHSSTPRSSSSSSSSSSSRSYGGSSGGSYSGGSSHSGGSYSGGGSSSGGGRGRR